MSDDRASERGKHLPGFTLLALAGWVGRIGFVRWAEPNTCFTSGTSVQLGAAPAWPWVCRPRQCMH